MRLSDLKRYYKSGLIESASILPKDEDIWVVECKMLNGKKEQLVKARIDEVKLYKSITGAIADLKSAGFQKVEVFLV